MDLNEIGAGLEVLVRSILDARGRTDRDHLRRSLRPGAAFPMMPLARDTIFGGLARSVVIMRVMVLCTGVRRGVRSLRSRIARS
jgi:hypothetical protein